MALSKRRMLANAAVINNMATKPQSPTNMQHEIEEFDKKINQLLPFSSRPIASLPENEKEIFEEVRNTVRKYYHTDHYAQIYSTALKHFPETSPPPTFLPKTVGSYFTGCLIQTNIDASPGCSLLCAGSMPLPSSNSSSWSFCSQNVIWCLLNIDVPPSNANEVKNISGDFEFLFLTRISGSPNAVLFLNYPSYDEFPGFTETEKSILKKLKIFNIRLLSYDKTGTDYTELSGGNLMKLNEVKTRNEDVKARAPKAVVDKLMSTADPVTASKAIVSAPDPFVSVIQQFVCAVVIGLAILLVYLAYRSIVVSSKR